MTPTGGTMDGATVFAFSPAGRLPGYDGTGEKSIRAFKCVGGGTPRLHGLKLPLVDMRLRVSQGEAALTPAIAVVGFDGRIVAILVDDLGELVRTDEQEDGQDDAEGCLVGVTASDHHSIVLLAVEQPPSAVLA